MDKEKPQETDMQRRLGLARNAGIESGDAGELNFRELSIEAKARLRASTLEER